MAYQISDKLLCPLVLVTLPLSFGSLAFPWARGRSLFSGPRSDPGGAGPLLVRGGVNGLVNLSMRGPS